jgi:hypothetical protein
MSYSQAVPHSRSGGGGFSPFLLLLVLLAIVGSTLVVMASHAAKRHGEEFVKAVSSQCNESKHKYHFYRESDNRHAYLCFLEEYGFVFTIKNFDPAQIEKWKSDLVTAFDRKGAKTFQDAIDYITCTKNGIPVEPCVVRGGAYLQVP